jgi:hypothetical protein
MVKPPFPEVLDSTIVAAGRSCGRTVELEHFFHWKPRSVSVHLHAGGAFAKGLEIAREAFYLNKLSEPEAIAEGLLALIHAYGDFECPPDSAKSLERMMGAYEYYFTQYPMESDHAIPVTLPSGKRGIEFSFAEPLEILHPETGNPLIYCGRMDMLTNYAGGVFGEDDKTTSQLGASWSKQWDLRSQFTGYCWGAARAGFPINGFLVRGISILKTKYETQQALTYRTAWMIDRWYEQLHRDIKRLIEQWESGKFDYNLDHSCAEYGGCVFRQICLSEPANQGTWLESSFVKRKWNPLTREEELL